MGFSKEGRRQLSGEAGFIRRGARFTQGDGAPGSTSDPHPPRQAQDGISCLLGPCPRGPLPREPSAPLGGAATSTYSHVPQVSGRVHAQAPGSQVSTSRTPPREREGEVGSGGHCYPGSCRAKGARVGSPGTGRAFLGTWTQQNAASGKKCRRIFPPVSASELGGRVRHPPAPAPLYF